MKVDIRCEKHPKYTAQREPQSCDACEILYWLRQEGFRYMRDGGSLELVPKKSRKKTLTTP